MPSRFPSVCPTCGKEIKRDERIIYWPRSRKAEHYTCGEAEYLKCASAMYEEDNGSAFFA
jgi:hypothetical protein